MRLGTKFDTENWKIWVRDNLLQTRALRVSMTGLGIEETEAICSSAPENSDDRLSNCKFLRRR